LQYRRVAWGIETNEILTSWVDMFLDDNGKPVGLVQSQNSGLHVFHSVDPNIASIERSSLKVKVHHGFCRPALTRNKNILCPSGHDTFYYLPKAILQSEGLEVGESKSIESGQGASLVFLHPFVHKDNEYVMFGTEDGKIHVVRSPLGESNEKSLSSLCLMDHVSKIGKKMDPIVPLCCAGDETSGFFVIGTTSTDLPLLKWDGESETLVVNQVKSIVNKGIGCLALRPDKKLLAAGCWDGRIRLFTFPGMRQLVVLDFHKATITSLLFLDKVDDWTGTDQYYLVCGAKDNRLTGWDLFNKKSRPQSQFVKEDKDGLDWEIG